MFAHFMGDLRVHLPTPRWAVFDQKRQDSRAPPSLFTWSHPEQHFLFPQVKKIFKEKCFADVEEVKQKTTEALKGIKIYKFKNCFEQWRKLFNRCAASNGEYFEGDWSFKHVRINTHF